MTLKKKKSFWESAMYPGDIGQKLNYDHFEGNMSILLFIYPLREPCFSAGWNLWPLSENITNFSLYVFPGENTQVSVFPQPRNSIKWQWETPCASWIQPPASVAGDTRPTFAHLFTFRTTSTLYVKRKQPFWRSVWGLLERWVSAVRSLK